MATKLTTFDFSAPSAITSSEKATYPWEEWLDGDIWQLEEGEDFETHPLMMERIIRTRATARGAKVTVRHQPMTFNGKPRKNNPFGYIVLQRTDCIGPMEMAANGAARDAKKAEAAAKRATRKAAAAAEAEALLKSKGIKTVARPVNGKPVAKKAISKRPAKLAKAASK